MVGAALLRSGVIHDRNLALGDQPDSQGPFFVRSSFRAGAQSESREADLVRRRPRLRWTAFRGQIAHSESDLSCFVISVSEKNPTADVDTSHSHNMKSEHLEAPHESTLRSRSGTPFMVNRQAGPLRGLRNPSRRRLVEDQSPGSRNCRTATLLSQRAEPSPLWCGTSPKRRIRRRTTGIARVRCDKANRGCGSHDFPQPRRRVDQER